MCGITGFINLRPESVANPIQKMNDSLKHRGPDAGSVFQSEDGHYSLGHRRLSIIDLTETANQPMHSTCGNFVIVFNGEVYNFQEVKAELITEKSIQFKTNSDTEVVLESLIHWGENAVSKFNGMFAFALLNKTSGEILFGRDRLGKKPLYYFKNDDCFAFASELKALLPLASQFGKFSLNHYAVNQYLRLGYIHEPHSIYTEIKKLPCASLMRYSNHNLTVISYWNAYEKVTEKVLSNEDAAKKELQGLIDSSVAYRMIADVPLGVFLSGGIDSSVVAAFAQRKSAQPIQTFSIGFKEAKYNESVHAEAVAKNIGAQHHTFEVSYQDAIDMVETYIHVYDEPYADSSGIPTMLVSKLARENVTCVLTGDGGDEQFMGYGMYQWANRLNNPLLKTFKKPISSSLSMFGNQRLKRAAPMFDYSNSTHLPSHIFSIEQYFYSEKELKEISKLNEKLVFENKLTKRKLLPAEIQSLFDITHYLPGDLLVKVDRATMQHSIEARCPLLDYRILEFSINLDSSLKIKNNQSKHLLKEVLYDYVPKALFDRPKWGFGLPIRIWLKNEMRFLVDQYLNKEKLESFGLLDVKNSMNIVDLYMKGSDILFNKVWSLLCLMMWFEKNKEYFHHE